jgi:OmpA-OmpF porin, OOP family
MARPQLVATHALAAGLHIAQIIVTIVVATLTTTAAAQEIRQYRATDRVDPHDVARILRLPTTPDRAPKMRSLRVLDASSTARADAMPVDGATVSEVAQPSALALPIQFAFDSANILSQARAQLDALAAGIKLLPADQLVVIEGHTDAIGAEHYNLQLSTRRAAAVKEYLVRMHEIESGRLATEGYGKFRPINATDNRAPENRRVQFRGG